MVPTTWSGLPFLFTVLYRVYALEVARQAIECARCFHTGIRIDDQTLHNSRGTLSLGHYRER